jgi:starch synthase (maltosyl-transferring)
MEAHISNPPQTQIAVRVPAGSRVVIEAVSPQVDGGRFAIKRTVGEKVVVEADIFADGHEVLAASLLYKPSRAQAWQQAPMRLFDNDRWRGEFTVTTLETFLYTLQAWVDDFQTWSRDFLKKYDAGQDISVDLLIGADLLFSAARRARGADAKGLSEFASRLRRLSSAKDQPVTQVLGNADLADLVARYPDRSAASSYPGEFRVIVDRERARFSSWYELFPRSCTSDPAHHGTFLDCIGRLDYVAGMGFDVLYLPPIHPIGQKRSQGEKQFLSPDARRPRQPLGHRISCGRPQVDSPPARHPGGLPAAANRSLPPRA